MARLTSLYGKTTGKIGSIVFSTTAGQTIAREYNPNVSNPSTEAQVNTRAKFKLLSQVAAALAQVIVIPKEGLKSARNRFVSINYDLASATSGVAQLSYENLQITDGKTFLPAISATRDASIGISVELSESLESDISRVVYILYRKTSESTLQYVQDVIVDAAGANSTYPATLVYTEGDVVIFAYGISDLTANATAKYNSYEVSSAEDIARLRGYRSLKTSDYKFTETRGATMFSGENQTAVVGENQARVYVTASAGGSVTGSGVYDIGSEVTVVATPDSGKQFVGWRNNGSNEYISTSATYTFDLQATTDLIADFEDAPITLSTPVIVANGSSESSSRQVTITADEGATIYYTTNGVNPTTSSNVYSEPFTIVTNTTIKAYAVLGNSTSEIASATIRVGGGGD